ncbi:hypothetical protein GCK32_009604 [Trichostrongylus colubriformis]|uniref:Uncharacterized protein n=1 Tax=Trichostrongylus colubriformis TaxID=6319 RepID=A0AAN8IES0_TRICO
MVPEGSNPVSTTLAVISYMGKKGKPMPVFKISFDRMRWFEIGNITTKELDDYIEYMVMINQRPEVYVQYNLTKDGTYKFSIEAHDDGSMQTASISVDVLSLSPTTRRSTTTPVPTTPSTTTTESTTPADLLQTTTPLMTTSTVPKTPEAAESPDALTTPITSEHPETSTTALNRKLSSSTPETLETAETSEASETLKILMTSTTTEASDTPKGLIESVLDSSAIVETARDSNAPISMAPDTIVSPPAAPSTVPIVSVSKSVSNELKAASESGDGSVEDHDLVLSATKLDVKSKEVKQVITTEAPLSGEDPVESELTDDSSELLQPKNVTAKGRSDEDDDEEEDRKENNIKAVTEGSGTSTASTEVVEDFEKAPALILSSTTASIVTETKEMTSGESSVPSTPIAETASKVDDNNETATSESSITTQGLEAVSEEAEELEVIFEGTKNGTFKLGSPVRSGDLVRGLAISLKIGPKGKNSYTNLSLDRTDIFDIRPKLIFTGNKAYLFVKDPALLSSPVTVKIMAERPNSASIKELTLLGSPKKPSASVLRTSPKSTDAVDEYEFSITEDTPSGSTVGQIRDGESKRVVGPPGL